MIRATKSVPRTMSTRITPVITTTSFKLMLAPIFSFSACVIFTLVHTPGAADPSHPLVMLPARVPHTATPCFRYPLHRLSDHVIIAVRSFHKSRVILIDKAQQSGMSFVRGVQRNERFFDLVH